METNNKQSTAEWLARERSVTLTNEEWCTLTTYLSLTAKKFCEESQSRWERLAGEGSVKNAEANANYWKYTATVMESIIQKLNTL